MIGRTICFGTLVCGLLLVPRGAEAQAPSADNTNSEVMQAIQQLRADLTAAFKREVDAAVQGLVTEERFDAVAGDLKHDIDGNAQGLGQLKQDFEKNKEDVAGLIEEQRRILDAISTSDGQGNRMLAMNNMMSSSPQFRQEMSSAVHQSIRREGTLRVRNRTGSYQLLDVNRQRLEIPPYTEIFDIRVPVGTLTTELVGQERTKNWTVTAPDYFQEIVIEPSSPSRWYVGSPLVYDYPTIFW